MTKSLYILLLLLLTSYRSSANRIDALKTKTDVVRFINTLKIDTTKLKLASLNELLNNECQIAISRRSIHIWEKADFNNDGLTDLMAIISDGDQIINIVVMDKGNNTFDVSQINHMPNGNCEFVTCLKKNNKQLLLFHFYKFSYAKESKTTDTLIYKFASFIELNKHPAKYQVDSIELKTGPCYGMCPTEELDISKDGRVKYIGGEYSKKTGTYYSAISKYQLDSITNLINYIKIKKLSNNYRVNWTDDATSYLTIKFTDGSIKKIKDYGGQGTFGLRRLYGMILDLILTQNWSS